MSAALSPIPLAPPVPISFPQERSALLRRLSALPKLENISPASRLEVRPAPEMAASGIRELDSLAGGLPRGCLTEFCGPASSGRTSSLLAALAAATRRQEACTLVDTTDAFHPQSATDAGVDLARLLWIRCVADAPSRRRAARDDKPLSEYRIFENRVEQALRALDLLLQSGGFGLVAVDFSDVPFQAVRRIPLTSWFRFQRAVEHTPTVLLVTASAPCAQTCASLVFRLKSSVIARQPGEAPALITRTHNFPAHAQLLEGLEIEGELLRSRLERKPVQAVKYATRAERTG
jgi:hypothetical protein